ncbi:hypothetical protein BGY98DRAFT_296838 [Russula aff. rugulosa BPL654]|nr:hypothetical protein BGY98DRAFT_296838 [Russula aff. rugulosa BPL654]
MRVGPAPAPAPLLLLFVLQRCCCCCSGGKQEIRKGYDGYCGAGTRAARDPRTRAVLKSRITSLSSSRESQGCPACTVVKWNVGGEMSRTRAARGPHSSHRTISASSTSPTGTPTPPSCSWPWSSSFLLPASASSSSYHDVCGPCPCQCQ